ncbi:MAG: uroporphyrinogen decarboxylase family protein, partial [Candidatus Heimdallarchaeota archaeon]
VSYDSFCQHPSVDSTQVNLNASMERSSVGGMWRKVEPDGSNRDIWGAHRRRVPHQYGAYDEFASFPLEEARSVEDLKKYEWPQPDWWNFDNLRSFIDKLNDTAVYNIRYRIGSVFETSWSLYGFEKFLLDLAVKPEMPRYVMERIAEVHLENLRTVLEIAGDLIDIVYFYDDVASQQSLLISPHMYEDFVQPYHQEIIDIAKSYGKPTMMHCCGAVYPLIEKFIDMGLVILNPIQPTAEKMNPERLAQEFGGRIAFHGGIDIQHFLPTAKAEQVKEKVKYISDVLGKNGGYIMAGSHHIQADTPIENILAMYEVL